MFDHDQIHPECEDARDKQVLAYRRDMDHYTREAMLAVQHAVSALSALRSSRIFDVEYAEGDAGRDVSELLRAIQRDLRSVQARQIVLNTVD